MKFDVLPHRMNSARDFAHNGASDGVDLWGIFTIFTKTTARTTSHSN